MNTKKNVISFQVISKYRTLLMGMSIWSIILFHYTEDCVHKGYNLNPFIVSYKAHIGSCGVDIFLFLSGVGLYYSFKKNPNKKEFYLKRLLRILLPYCLVAIPAWSLLDLIFLKSTITQLIKDILFVSFFQKGAVWFWYILMILVCYLIFPYIFSYIEEEEGYIKKIVVTFTICVTMALLLKEGNPDLFSRTNIALLRFPAFMMGCIAGKASYEEVDIPKEIIGVSLFSFLLMLIRGTSEVILSRYILGLFGIAGMIWCSILLEVLNQKGVTCSIIKKVVEWSGKYSLELYLIHVALRKIMRYLGYGTYRFKYECVLIIITILFACILKRITSCIEEKIKYIKKFQS